ncbi:MAG: putative FAD-binding dehydrogenase [Bryobacterales bacterium]|nr:putative FAD-binding dehydrogenase [Bryobacterales bacterium]
MTYVTRRRLLQAAGSLLVLPRLSGLDKELHCDVAVIGGGVGGFAAALAALREGMRVVLTEETDWIGGQLTSQAVPPDEHPWIEMFGCTRSYRNYRNAVRDYYRVHYPLTSVARSREDLNPGNGSVSRLTHEFRVSVAVLESLLAPYQASGQLTMLLEHVPASATTTGDRVTSVTVQHRQRQEKRTITAQYFLDATELGDLLPMVKAEYVTGAESQAQTGEMHAAAAAQPANSQSFTFCFAVDLMEGEDHTIDRPQEYDFWRDYVPKMSPPWTGPLLNWTACEPKTLAPRKAYFDPNPSGAKSEGLNLWLYRRLADRANFAPGTYKSDITLVNWPQNDYWLGDLITANPAQKEEQLKRAKQLSFSFLYWMQTDAPRLDGGHGWKGLRLRKDLVGTEDGMAKAAYIRESRRIQAEFTVLEQHVGTDMRTKKTRGASGEVFAEPFPDSVGIGCYRIDLHPSAGGTNYVDISSLPFQIPLGSLIPKRLDNLLPACKNIGTTHITNGCYRLHPVEWNIGEAAGALAAYAIKAKKPPRAVRSDKKALAEFQSVLQARGFELAWPRIHPV